VDLPLYIFFFWAFLPEDLVLANKDALTPVQSSGRQFSSIPGIKLKPKDNPIFPKSKDCS